MNNRDKYTEFNHIRNRLAELRRALHQFRVDYAEVAGDEVLRFEFICERMFGTFVCQDAIASRITSVPPCNLDTGDAIAHPFPPFVAALRAETDTITTDAHHYYGPESIESLAKAAIHFLKRENFPTRRPLTELRVLPGAGLVHVYDALCRVLIEKEGDTVLVPELGYGFFLTQPHRAGGRVAVVACDNRGAVTPATLAKSIAEQNNLLWQDWKRDSEVLFDRDVRKIKSAGFITFKPDAQDSLSAIRKTLASAPEMWSSRTVAELLIRVAPELESHRRQMRVMSRLRPPRVVGFLHIQPTLTGQIYDEREICAMAEVLDRSHVVALEDLAYHSIRCRLRDLSSFQGLTNVTYTMLGMSKPFAIANLRMGLLYVDEEHYEQVKRALESTTGYVSALLQRSLAKALNADGYDDYIADLSWGPAGYEARERMMYRLLMGADSATSDDESYRARQNVLHSVADSPELMPFAEDFLRRGLERWFQPLKRSTAGFFQVISCAPLLELEAFRRLGIRSSFDVFALLAYVFDLRTIPEEAMRPGLAPGTRLRIAFSPDEAVFTRLFLRAFAGLTVLEGEEFA